MAKKKEPEYFVLVKCGCKNGILLTYERTPLKCPYCEGAGKRKDFRPHPSHRMSRWKTEILAPCGEPRFYRTRRCIKCKDCEFRHAAGHFLHSLGRKCRK